jgi:hypothetical protein
MLSAIKNVRPVIADFYTSISPAEQSIATVSSRVSNLGFQDQSPIPAI